MTFWLCVVAFRTGSDCMLLSGTCRPTGICWSGRENSWRRRRKSRWRDRWSTTLYLRASSTFSWTCGTWWVKSAVRYPQSSYPHFVSVLTSPKILEEVTPRSDNSFAFFSRWVIFRVLGRSQPLLWYGHPWIQKPALKQHGTAGWRVTSFWEI